jgi:hypothetical protein
MIVLCNATAASTNVEKRTSNWLDSFTLDSSSWQDRAGNFYQGWSNFGGTNDGLIREWIMHHNSIRNRMFMLTCGVLLEKWWHRMLRSLVLDVETVSHVLSINFSIWCLLLLRSFSSSRNRDHSCEQGMCPRRRKLFSKRKSPSMMWSTASVLFVCLQWALAWSGVEVETSFQTFEPIGRMVTTV